MTDAPVIQPTNPFGGASLAPDAGSPGDATINPTEARVQQQAAAAVAAQQAVVAYRQRERDVREHTDALAEYHGLPGEFRSTEAPDRAMIERRGMEISSLRRPRGVDLAANARTAEAVDFADWEQDQAFEGDKLHRVRDFLYYPREKASAGVTNYFNPGQGRIEWDLLDVQRAYNEARWDERDFTWEGKRYSEEQMAGLEASGMPDWQSSQWMRQSRLANPTSGRSGILIDPNSPEAQAKLEAEFQNYLKFLDTPLTFENKVYMPRVSPQRIAADVARNAARVEYNAAQNATLAGKMAMAESMGVSMQELEKIDAAYCSRAASEAPFSPQTIDISDMDVADKHALMVDMGFRTFEELGTEIAKRNDQIIRAYDAGSASPEAQQAAERADWIAYQNRGAEEQTNPVLREYAHAASAQDAMPPQRIFLFATPGKKEGTINLESPFYLSTSLGSRQLTLAEQKDLIGNIRVSLLEPVTGKDVGFRVLGMADDGDQLEGKRYDTYIPLLTGEKIRQEAYRTDTLQFPISVPGYDQPLGLSPTEPITEKQAESILENLGIAHRDPVSREIVETPRLNTNFIWSQGIADAADAAGDVLRDFVSKPLGSVYFGIVNAYPAYADAYVEANRNGFLSGFPGADIRIALANESKGTAQKFADFETGVTKSPENVVRNIGGMVTFVETVDKNPSLITLGNAVYLGGKAVDSMVAEAKENPSMFAGEVVGEALISLPFGAAMGKAIDIGAKATRATPAWIGRRVGLYDVGVESPADVAGTGDLYALSNILEGDRGGKYIRRVPVSKIKSSGVFVRDVELEATDPRTYTDLNTGAPKPEPGKRPVLYVLPDEEYAPSWAHYGSMFGAGKTNVFRLAVDKVPVTHSQALTIYRNVENSPIYGDVGSPYDKLEAYAAHIATTNNKPIAVGSYNKQFGWKEYQKEAEAIVIPAGGKQTQSVRTYFAGLSRDGRSIWNMATDATNKDIAKEFVMAWGVRIRKNNQIYIDWRAPL